MRRRDLRLDPPRVARRRVLALAAAAVALPGCALKSPPSPKELSESELAHAKLPSGFAAGGKAEPVQPDWLRSFNDPRLPPLADEALAYNADLRLAAARVEIAAAALKAAGAVAFCQHRTRELLDAVFADEQTLRLVLRDARGLDGAFDQVVADIDALVLRAMVRDLEAAQAAHLIRPGNTQLMARYLLGGVEKMVITAILADETIDLDAIVTAAVELQLFGILHEEVQK